MAIKSKIKTVTAKNPRELAKLLGLGESDAAEWEFRGQLNSKIIDLAKKAKLTQGEIAKRAGTSRTRISALLNRSRQDFSTDFMIRVINALGYQVDVKVRKVAS